MDDFTILSIEDAIKTPIKTSVKIIGKILKVREIQPYIKANKKKMYGTSHVL